MTALTLVPPLTGEHATLHCAIARTHPAPAACPTRLQPFHCELRYRSIAAHFTLLARNRNHVTELVHLLLDEDDLNYTLAVQPARPT